MKRLVAPLAALLVLTGCSAAEDPPAAAATPTCEPTPAVDLTRPEGWIGQIPALSENTGLVIDNGKGTVVEHRPDAVQPLASAVKVVHLAAYAQAVAAGTLDPNEQVPMSEWERWYLPGTDGGVHPKALQRLGIAHNEYGATDPAATVRLDDMVSAMVQESDNAVPDYLRHRLGDQALADAAATGGWTDFEIPTLIGTTLGTVMPTATDADLWALAQRYAFDADFHASVLNTAALPDYADQVAWFASHGPMGSAAQLTSFYRSVLDGKYGDSGATIRRQLEWLDSGPNFTSVGYKGGDVPGVLTQGFEFTRNDGSTATAVWLISGMDEATSTSVQENFGQQQQLIIQAVLNQSILDRIACVA